MITVDLTGPVKGPSSTWPNTWAEWTWHEGPLPFSCVTLTPAVKAGASFSRFALTPPVKGGASPYACDGGASAALLCVAFST